MVASLWGCSGSGSSGNTNSGPPKLVVDQAALLFGLETGSGVLVGTAPSNSVQVYNSGTGTITFTGATIGPGATTITEQLPLGAGGALVTSTIPADNTHPEFFTVTSPGSTALTGTAAAVVQVVFTPTLEGFFSASLNITSSAGSITVALAGDGVTPLVATADGGLSYTMPGAEADGGISYSIPSVTLKLLAGDDGGPVVMNDGGALYQTGYASTLIPLYNVGTSQLNFQTPVLDTNGDPSIWALCAQVHGGTQMCNAGPIPNNLPPVYADGGIFQSPLPGGGSIPLAAEVKILFTPAAPGTFTKTVTIASDATNTPSLVLTVTGTAVAP
jgi:hypothetical protein